MTFRTTPAQPPRNYPALRFGLDETNHASVAWGANCGPGAIAAVCGLTLDELRPHLGEFERKRYTNPRLMYEVLARLNVEYSVSMRDLAWPIYGLARVQWEGPWTAPGAPLRARRYRYTHWVGVRAIPGEIFDINCMSVGGWISIAEWSDQVVPWLLKECLPRASGKWHLTHSIEVLDCGRVQSSARAPAQEPV